MALPVPAQDAASKAADGVVSGLLDKGTLGLLCLILLALLVTAGFVIRHLHNRNSDLHDKSLEDRDSLVKALEASTNAVERFETALQGTNRILETRGQATADLAQRLELIGRDSEHGLRNLSTAVEGVARVLERIRDRDRGADRDRDFDRGRP